MSDKPKGRDESPERRAVGTSEDVQGEALAECYRILVEAGALEPKDGGEA